jgi:hypothetical protein
MICCAIPNFYILDNFEHVRKSLLPYIFNTNKISIEMISETLVKQWTWNTAVNCQVADTWFCFTISRSGMKLNNNIEGYHRLVESH